MKKTHQTFILAFIALFISINCSGDRIVRETHAFVKATMETEPVKDRDDTADDPCVWVHPTNPDLSLIIGTDKDENSWS